MKKELNNIIDATHIMSIETENSGGGCWLDFVTLSNGSVLVVNDEYASKEAFYNSTTSTKGFYLEGESCE